MQLTIVLAYRDRNLERVARCLASLARQTFTGFRVLFVDYGSSHVPSADVQRAVGLYPFCTHIRTETQGRPWNRSHALNIGIRQATSGYVMTSDIDLIFADDFLARLMVEAMPGRAVYAYRRDLPKGFNNWNHIIAYAERLPMRTQDAKGSCQVIDAAVLHEIRGFDEYYRYWGVEDRDLYDRLEQTGLETVWLSKQALMFHQWHPPVDVKTPGYIPEGVWGRMENHYYRCRDQVVRNDENWGQVHTQADRPALGFLDFEKRQLVKREDLTVLRLRVDQPREISHLVRAFWELPSGHALAITGAFQPTSWAVTTWMLRGINRGLRMGGRKTRLDYAANCLHSYFIEMLEDNAGEIADYYLNFPAEDGISLLVKG